MANVLNLKALAPRAPQARLNEISDWINQYAEEFGITTPQRLAAFVAQACHESDGFQALKEYASGKAYEGRRDLGNRFPGDGVRFKGRGIFQITGRANYEKYSKRIFGDTRLIANPSILEQPQYAVLSAFHFWKDRNLNSLADNMSFDAITKRVNGGQRGRVERQKYFRLALGMLGINQNPVV